MKARKTLWREVIFSTFHRQSDIIRNRFRKSSLQITSLQSVFLAFTFLLNLRLKHINWANLVRTTYGVDGIRGFWKYGNTLYKLEKAKLDVDFLKRFLMMSLWRWNVEKITSLQSVFLAFTFLLNLRLKHINLANLVRTTYGVDGIRGFWKYGNTLYKLEKAKLDVDFLKRFLMMSLWRWNVEKITSLQSVFLAFTFLFIIVC